MSSIWNKYKDKSRISRLVSEPAGNSFSVETGFPTSIAGLFRKSHKSSKKRHRSKSSLSFTYDPSSSLNSSSFSSSVSDSPVNPPRLEMPTCSIDSNSNLYVEENVVRRNPSFKSNRDDSNYECEIEGYGDVGRVSNSNSNSIWLLILKGVVFLVVGIYTKSFVLGVSIGAFLFLLIEYLGKSIFGLLKPCEDARRKLLGLPKSKRMVDNKKNEMINVGVKREKVLLSTRAMEAKIASLDSKKREAFEYEFRSDHLLIPSIEVDENGEGFASNDELEKELGENGAKMDRVDSQNREIIEYEVQNDRFSGLGVQTKEDIDGELEQEVSGTLEDGVQPNSSCSCSIPFGLWGSKDAIELEEIYEMVEPDVKVKHRRNKFWKKFVPEKKRYKRLKVQDISLVWEEGNEKEAEEEKTMDKGVNSSSSSFPSPSLDEKEAERDISVVDPINAEVLNSDKCTEYSGMMQKKGMKLRCLGFLGVVLAGLVGGRVFALVVTLICCLMIKMLRG